MAVGGKAKPVYIVSDEEIASGAFKVEQGPAVRVHGMDSEELASNNRGVEGGNLQPVYLVEEGERRIQGGKAITITDVVMDSRSPVGHIALPVYVVNLWPDPITFVSVTTAEADAAGSLTILHPPNTILNDLLIAQISYGGGALGPAQVITPPAGWTVIMNERSIEWMWVGWKLVTTPQPADFTWTFDSNNDSAGSISAYRCVDVLDPIDSAGATNSGSSKNPKGKGPKTSKDNTKLMLLVSSVPDDATINAPPKFIRRSDVGGASTSDKRQPKKGQAPDADAELNSSQAWQSIMIAIAPCTTYAATVTVRLTWDDNASDEDGYYVERSTDGIVFVQVASIAANSITWDDTGVETGQTLWYRVRAYNGDGNSGYSNTASVAA